LSHGITAKTLTEAAGGAAQAEAEREEQTRLAMERAAAEYAESAAKLAAEAKAAQAAIDAKAARAAAARPRHARRAEARQARPALRPPVPRQLERAPRAPPAARCFMTQAALVATKAWLLRAQARHTCEPAPPVSGAEAFRAPAA